MLLVAVLLFSLAACGKTETDQPSGDTTVSQSDFTTEDTRPSESGTEEETESVKAELQYNIGYYAFEDIGDGFIDGRSLIFYDDGTVDYDWATYDAVTVGDYQLEYNGKTIYMVAGPSGDTYSYSVSDDQITITDWSGASTVLVLTSDGTLRIEQTTSEVFTEGAEYAMQ